jgi:hypothetical protein
MNIGINTDSWVKDVLSKFSQDQSHECNDIKRYGSLDNRFEKRNKKIISQLLGL